MLSKDLIAYIEQLADPRLAADWDQSGLQVAGSKQTIHRLALSLDPTPESIKRALDWQADFVLTHHPLSLSPRLPARIDDLHTVYSLLFTSGVHLYAAHTSLDVQSLGPVGWLARALHLSDVRPVHPIQAPARVWVSFPWQASDHTALQPVLSHSACLEQAWQGTECFLLVPEAQLTSILQALATHTRVSRVSTSRCLPLNAAPGYGIIGHMPQPLSWPEFARELASHLPGTGWRRTGRIPDAIQTVAYCPGSGMDLGSKALSQGADVFISGDLKYHQAQDLEPLGLILDVGHFALEEAMMADWARHMDQELSKHDVQVTFIPGHDPLVHESSRDWTRA